MQSPEKRASRLLAGDQPQQYLRLEQKYRQNQRLEARKGRGSRHISVHAPPKKCIWNSLLRNSLFHKGLAPIGSVRHGDQPNPRHWPWFGIATAVIRLPEKPTSRSNRPSILFRLRQTTPVERFIGYAKVNKCLTAPYPTPRKARFQLLVRHFRAGFYPRVPTKGFQLTSCSLASFPKLLGATLL